MNNKIIYIFRPMCRYVVLDWHLYIISASFVRYSDSKCAERNKNIWWNFQTLTLLCKLHIGEKVKTCRLNLQWHGEPFVAIEWIKAKRIKFAGHSRFNFILSTRRSTEFHFFTFQLNAFHSVESFLIHRHICFAG